MIRLSCRPVTSWAGTKGWEIRERVASSEAGAGVLGSSHVAADPERAYGDLEMETPSDTRKEGRRHDQLRLWTLCFEQPKGICGPYRPIDH